jgi:hypothetical protein
MNAQLLQFGDYAVTPLVLIAVGATVQWMVFALVSLFSRERQPKKGLRAQERNLLVSSIFGAVAFFVQIEQSPIMKRPAALQASALTTSKGSCAQIEEGMTVEAVKAKMGAPDETRAEEELRGPGASVMLYRSSRCAVHVLDRVVDSVD